MTARVGAITALIGPMMVPVHGLEPAPTHGLESAANCMMG